MAAQLAPSCTLNREQVGHALMCTGIIENEWDAFMPWRGHDLRLHIATVGLILHSKIGHVRIGSI